MDGFILLLNELFKLEYIHVSTSNHIMIYKDKLLIFRDYNVFTCYHFTNNK